MDFVFGLNEENIMSCDLNNVKTIHI
jgi:hypothetical protein